METLSDLVGVDLRELHPSTRADGVIVLRGRKGHREVDGQYDPLTFHLTYVGRADDGREITNDVRGKSHADMTARFQALIAWLRGQDQQP